LKSDSELVGDTLTTNVDTPRQDVVVIGGGIVGLCCAHALARHGASVTILETERIGAGASSGNMGWITPSLAVPLATPGILTATLRASLRGSPPLAMRLDPSLGPWLWRFFRSSSLERFRAGAHALAGLLDATATELARYEAEAVRFERHESGLLVVGMSVAGLSWVPRLLEQLEGLGHPACFELLDGDAAREREPSLGPATVAAAYAPGDHYVRPESLCDALGARLAAEGAIVRTGTRAHTIERRGSGLVVRSTGGEVDADAVIVAAGTGTNALLRPLGHRLPIVAARGYSVTMRGAGATPRTALYLSERRVGLSPYSDGLRIGGFFELGRAPTAVDPRRIEQLLDAACSYLREWRPEEQEPAAIGAQAWSGSRPSTPDSLPFIGELPGMRGVYVAAGHGMLGVTLGPATGACLADLVIGRPAPALKPFGLVGRPR
jgi:D-amino-acid dehydrogenase